MRVIPCSIELAHCTNWLARILALSASIVPPPVRLEDVTAELGTGHCRYYVSLSFMNFSMREVLYKF